MTNAYLHSVVLELQVTNNAALPATMGHQAHALFLDLIKQVDPALATRLHDEPNYRPFTVSPLSGVPVQGDSITLRAGQTARLRITLLDGGQLWRCLSTCFLTAGSLCLRLGAAEFALHRLLAMPGSDSEGWAGFTDWPSLAASPARRSVTLCFATPTAFNLGDKHFALFPEPIHIWDSFMRVWNNYAPAVLQLDKPHLRTFITDTVVVADYQLHTATLHYPKHVQKGFVGTCTYLLREQGPEAAQLAALAEFARYAGVGYKTTMGMGQARLQEPIPAGLRGTRSAGAEGPREPNQAVPALDAGSATR
jgi:CRISPR-associated endoribonuclease Cas6